ncbi:MAG: hypothetical protein RIQ33_2055 [Bacteroidota bacterium]
MNFKTKYLVAIFTCISIILSHHLSIAQCTNNLDFETGNLANWRVYIDSSGCNPVCGDSFLLCQQGCSSASRKPCAYQGINAQQPGRVQVVTGAGLDPYSNLPIICPYPGYGNFALQLGNSAGGSQSEKVRAQFIVTAANSNLVYRYAAVMNDVNPAHDSCVKSKIVFNAYDYGPASNPYATPIEIPCGSVFLKVPSPDNIPPGWFISTASASTSNPIICSNWLPVALNLTSVIGNIVSLEFSTYDCGQGGHFGYAYVDIRCQNFTLSSAYCQNNKYATLFAPPGFADYIWDTAGTGPPVIAHTANDSFSLPTPNSALVYSVSLVPYSSPSCSLVVTDSLRLLPQPTAFFNYKTDSFACGLVSFFDSSYTNVLGSNVSQWSWNFGDKWSTKRLSNLKNPTHVYSRPGTYTVSLSAKTDLNCTTDTFLKTIVILPSPLTMGFTITSIDSLECSAVNFKDTSKTNLSYSVVNAWSWDFGDATSGANNYSTIKNPTHKFLKAGTYTIKLAITTDIGCTPDTLIKTFVVKPIPINADAGRDTVFCHNGSMHLNAYANQDYAPYIYTWAPNLFINDITVLDPYVTPPATQYYTFTAATIDGCSRTDSVLVSVSNPFYFNLPDSVAPTCLGRSVQLQFIPNENQTGSKITWYSNNTNATIICKNCYDPVYKSLKSDFVYAILYNEYWCSSRDTIWVPYIECPEIIVPTAFTPNGDGKNDNFFLLYKNFTKLNYFEVFNRWGEIVYSTTELTTLGWDGKFKGNEQPSGVYIFKIMATDFNGELKSLNGNVTLIR